MFSTHSADKEIDKYLKRKKSESVPKDIKNYKKNTTHCIHHFSASRYTANWLNKANILPLWKLALCYCPQYHSLHEIALENIAGLSLA